MTEKELDAWVNELENNSSEIYEFIGRYLNLEEEIKSIKKKATRFENALKEILKDEYSDNWYIANNALNEKK